ncbi:hypothetical protein DNM99_17345 [Salmonella enterica subsp. enterica serovar Poona]|nr:hypothetical protein [Salmonella enterica subsp. enterica serovar Poona]
MKGESGQKQWRDFYCLVNESAGLWCTDFIYSVSVKETLAGYNSEVVMKGIDFERLSPEKMLEFGEAMIRQARRMEEMGGTKDAVIKNLLPALQQVRQDRHAVQVAVDGLIDHVAALEKSFGRLEKIARSVTGEE